MMENTSRDAKDNLYTWLYHMNKFKGSNLFITINFLPAMKVDGKIIRLTDEPLAAEKCMGVVLSIMAIKQIEKLPGTNECNFATSLPDISRFRVNAMVQRGITALVFCAIIGSIPKFESLDLSPVLKEITLKKHGSVILVSGTGSDKPTPPASLIGYRNESTFDYIITIEDSIEFAHQHKDCIITRHKIGVDIESWMAVPKNTPHQALDVIPIGETRDRETMDYTIASVKTGHLCMATLHTNNTNQALNRIISLFPEECHTQLPTDLPPNPQALISQRLVPHEGGRGRVVAVEALLNSPLVVELVHEGRIYEIKEQMRKSTAMGIQTFDRALYSLYKRGDVSSQDALRNANPAHDLRPDIRLHSRHIQNTGPDPELIRPGGRKNCSDIPPSVTSPETI